MKGKPTSGGSLKSEPMWRDTSGCFATSAFLLSCMANSSFEPNGYAAAAQGGEMATGSDMCPFYAHGLSGSDYRNSSGDGIRPFYGHAMMGRGLRSRWSDSKSIRPFYGHAGY